MIQKVKDFFLNVLESTFGYLELNAEFKYLVEILFLIVALVLFFYDKDSYFVYFLMCWSTVAFFGFLVPKSIQSSVIMAPYSERKEDGKYFPGVPINIQLISKGGFIAGKPIELNVSVINIDDQFNSHKIFQELYDEFQIVYFHSWRVPINRKGKFLKGSPEGGGVAFDLKKMTTKTKVMFPNSGIFLPTIIYKLKSESISREIHPESNERFPNGTINISPHENYITIRNNSIIYSLTVVTLLLALIQTGLIQKP